MILFPKFYPLLRKPIPRTGFLLSGSAPCPQPKSHSECPSLESAWRLDGYQATSSEPPPLYPDLFTVSNPNDIFQGRDGTDSRLGCRLEVGTDHGQISSMESVLYPQSGESRRREDGAHE